MPDGVVVDSTLALFPLEAERRRNMVGEDGLMQSGEYDGAPCGDQLSKERHLPSRAVPT